LTFGYGGKPVRALPADIIRVVSEWPQNDPNDLAIRNIILNCIVSSEIKTPGSGFTFMNCLSSKNENVRAVLRSDMSDVFRSVERYLGRGICAKITKKIIEDVSIDASIEVFLSKNRDNFLIESSSALKVAGDFHELFSSPFRKLNSCGAIFIDGIIEKTSEIDCLLQDCAKEDLSLFLMARGFSPDVANTLHVNFENKKLRVYPYVVQENEEISQKLLSSNINVIDSQNNLILNTLTCSDISTRSDIIVDGGFVKILDSGSVDRHVTVWVPKRYQHQLGLIRDRLLFGMSVALQTAKFGIAFDEKNKAIASVENVLTARKTMKSYQKTIQDLGCIILEDV